MMSLFTSIIQMFFVLVVVAFLIAVLFRVMALIGDSNKTSITDIQIPTIKKKE